MAWKKYNIQLKNVCLYIQYTCVSYNRTLTQTHTHTIVKFTNQIIITHMMIINLYDFFLQFCCNFFFYISYSIKKIIYFKYNFFSIKLFSPVIITTINFLKKKSLNQIRIRYIFKGSYKRPHTKRFKISVKK